MEQFDVSLEQLKDGQLEFHQLEDRLSRHHYPAEANKLDMKEVYTM